MLTNVTPIIIERETGERERTTWGAFKIGRGREIVDPLAVALDYEHAERRERRQARAA